MSSSLGLEESLVAGTPFADRFIVERMLGRGGMGVVFAARHRELDELVAIKVMRPDIAANPETATRFFREARASVRIKSDYVVRVLDVAHLEDGTPYMVMEYLEGVNLDTLLEEHGRIALETAARYIIEAADAIAAAHAIGIVHRDIKPQNLFLARQGDASDRIKVLDFGISKLSEPLSPLDASLTQTSSVMGSPLYMSPEQMQSAKTVDQRADIWALGCVFYELLTGQPPFNAGTVPELCAKIFTEPAPAPSQLRPGLPKAVNLVIARCLEKSAELRYSSVAQLAQELLAFAPDAGPIVASISRRRSSLPPPSTTPVVAIPAQPKIPTITSNSWGHVTRPPSRRKRRLGRLNISVVAGAAVVISISFWALRRGTGKSTPAAVGASIAQLAAASDPSGVSSAPATLQPVQPDSARASRERVDAGSPKAPAAFNESLGDKAASGAKSGLARRSGAFIPSAATTQSAASNAAATTSPAAPRAPSLKIDIK